MTAQHQTSRMRAVAPFDTADYLAGPADAAAYLRAALEESSDDPAGVTRALGAIARSGNMSALARQIGMSREGLYKALSPHGNPSFATVTKIATALGLRIRIDPVDDRQVS